MLASFQCTYISLLFNNDVEIFSKWQSVEPGLDSQLQP